MVCFVSNIDAAGGGEMAKKKLRAWTKDDVRMLKTLAREKTKTTVIARKLKRTLGATYQKAAALGMMLGGGRGKRRERRDKLKVRGLLNS